MRPINVPFKRTTPNRILTEVRRRYAQYLVEADEATPWEGSDLQHEIESRMKPGDWIFHLRDGGNMTQEELGRKLGGVSGSRVSDWEANRRAVSKAMAKKLSKVLGVSAEHFI